MSTRPPNSDRLEETLESTRRSVRQLEIDAYRIRADLTRIEAVLEDDVAFDDPGPSTSKDAAGIPTSAASSVSAPAAPVHAPVINPSPSTLAPAAAPDWQPAAAPLPEGMEILVGASPQISAPVTFDSPPQIVADPDFAELAPIAELTKLPRRRYRRATPPVMTSLVVHCVILFLTASITIATIVEGELPFTAKMIELPDEPPVPLENLDTDELGRLDDAQLQNTISDSPQFDVAGPLIDEVVPVDFQSVDGATNLGDMGTSNAFPTDLGTAMIGSGGLGADGTGAPSGLGTGNQRKGGGGTRNGGPLGSTLFFGTESKGDRFVYVVDNSSSMKGGRLEMAIAELVKSVGTLSAKQTFYVIFVSDQTYPMFYPLPEPAMIPATAANKQRLAQWLPKAILASGKNRELIKAMDLAASLRPQTVFLLWDGDMKYSDKVRTDVMTHLTQPNLQWNFAIHTLGLGVTSLDSEYNLTAIAKAHGGTYRRIELPTPLQRLP